MRHEALIDDDKHPSEKDHDETKLPNNICDEITDFHEESVNLAKVVEEKIQKNEFYCGYELCPSKNEALFKRFFIETQSCSPTFYALTWHESLSSNEDRYPALASAKLLPRHNLLLHCAAKDLKFSEAEKILNEAIKLGVTNIFALRGNGETVTGDFPFASDFVKFIREHFGSQFCIAVAGYPEMHPQSSSKNLDLFYLKTKVDAGANLIISQIFFEAQLFIKFVEDCRKIGISVPIIPGIFPFSSFKSLKRMSNICQIKIPSWLSDTLSRIDADADDEAVTRYGIDLSVKIIKEIWQSRASNGYHLFILNRSYAAAEIFRRLGLNQNKDINCVI